jgi:hypothetical protein
MRAVTEREVAVTSGGPEPAALSFVDLDAMTPVAEPDPVAIVLTCANCGARMDERKCKLICSCGYFASCSDYY